MSQQHLKWIELVKERIEKRGWSQTDLAIVVGVSPSAITQLFKDGKGSDDLKLRINKKLRINESWEKFEEQEMNNTRQDNDLIKEIIEKHFENMVDDVLEHTETYYEALGAVSCIKGSKIPNMIQLADCLGKAIRKRAMQQKTPNHKNQALEDYAFERMCTT